MKGTRMDVVAVLKRAKQHIEQGWCQNRSHDGYGNVCAAQALILAVDEDPTSLLETNTRIEIAGRVLLTAALERTNMMWTHIPHWNDFSGRTKDEVVDTFEHAIKLAERDMEVASG